MKSRLRLAAWCAAIALPAAAAPDEWELLPAPPFPFGVSSGGGLATDGTFLYAADLSGDADHDFVDLDDDHACGPGELLGDLGIANASVRIARYDPRTNAWQPLPAIDTAWGGDSFSAGNLNRPLFCAGGSLYYYQFRAGPQRCVLHRYDLAAAPGGAWQQLWDKDADAALITANAGIVGADSPAGPVILHHRGGGAYEFCRTSALASGGLHATLTPDWPFDAAHFPRNGGWEFDPNSGHLYHMSGNQLLRWSPSPAYPDASFLTSEPVPGPPLAAFAAAAASLRDALGWNPGGSAPNPGASLWGNSITAVNDPSGVAGGPAGEDTGAGAVYLVRGETSTDGWPFNEGRGLVTNGDFARWFPATNAFQPLPRAPFDVGKGSAAAYHDGHLYLTQGDTRSSPDAAGNDSPLNIDGIRRPGNGFARFRIRAATYTTGHPVIPIASLLHAGFATATTSPLAAGTAADMLDGDRATSGTTAGANPAIVTITFPGAKSTGAARGVFAADAHQWTLDAADSEADLAAGSGTFVRVFGPQAVGGEGPHWQQWNEAPVARRIFRFTVARDAGGPVEIRELELQYAKQIHTLEVGGRQVQVNHLEILPASLIVRAGQPAQLAAELSLSLGPERHDATA